MNVSPFRLPAGAPADLPLSASRQPGLSIEPNNSSALPRKDNSKYTPEPQSGQHVGSKCQQLRGCRHRQCTVMVCWIPLWWNLVLTTIWLRRYNGEEEFFCNADTCTQDYSNGSADWSCHNLKCHCRANSTFCGAVPVRVFASSVLRVAS